MSFKLLDFNGLKTLSAIIKQIRTAADDNSSAVSGLGDDVQELTSQLAAALSEVESCLTELDNVKANIAIRKDLSLAADGWVEAEDEDAIEYPYKYALPIADVTENSRADAVLDASSAEIAAYCHMSTTTETVAGSVIFRSRTVPEAAITGQLYITQGAAPATPDEGTPTT